MSLSHKCSTAAILSLEQKSRRNTKIPSAKSACFRKSLFIRGSHNNNHDSHVEQMARIRDNFCSKIQPSFSSYDTAWVSMVPSMESPFRSRPCFPECLDWVMKNQNTDGSWGLIQDHPFLIKDSLSSTLACVLALHKWGVGELLVQRGLDFIALNVKAVNDKNQYSPVGFDLIFPGMINCANASGLNLPCDLFTNLMHSNRDLEIQRNRARFAYVAEGFGESFDWNDILCQQRSNGSFFNSPATTAASMIHLPNDRAFEYLQSVLKEYNHAVPTIYPLDIYSRLYMVDSLVKLGIDRYFTPEIETVLRQTYSAWLERNEEIFSDVICCAMAFRLLRMNRFIVSSDALEEYVEKERFFNTTSLQFTNTNTIFELYKASLARIHTEESVLERLHAWTSSFLKDQILNEAICEQRLRQEVEYALKYPYGSLERVEAKRNIKLFEVDDFRLLKTTHRCTNMETKGLHRFSVQDFNMCQDIHQQELEKLERWIKDCRLEHLEFARLRPAVCFFFAAATIFPPELSDVRMSFAKNSILITVVDDLFDVDGSKEELLKLIELVEKWHEKPNTTDCSTLDCSKNVEIIFKAIYGVVDDDAAKAFILQGQCVKQNFIKTWLVLLRHFMKELKQWSENITLDEYLDTGYVTTAVGPVLFNTLYLCGAKLSEETVRSEEYYRIYKKIGIICRLCNDLQSFKRERAEGTANSLFLLMQGPKPFSEEEGIAKMKGIIESNIRNVLKMVLQKEGSLLPETCKDLCWKMIKMTYCVYQNHDVLTDPREFIGHINEVLNDRLDDPSENLEKEPERL